MRNVRRNASSKNGDNRDMKNNTKTRNENKSSFERINQVIGIVASIMTILGFTAITMFTPIIDNIPFVNEHKMEKKIESLRIGFDREYIESVIGKPNSSDSFKFTDKLNGEITNVSVKEYYNDYYFGKLYYKDNERLISYIVTSRKKSFNPMLPQKENGRRLSSSMLNKINMVYYKTSHLSGRNDNSYYYLEFEHPWLGDDYLLYGFAYSSVGFSYKQSQNVIGKLVELRNTSLTAQDGNNIYKIDKSNESKNDRLILDDLKAELPANTVVVIDDGYVSSFDFLDEIGASGIGFNHLDIDRTK